MAEISYMMHPLPSVFLMELDIPEGFVAQLNEYLDGLLEQEGRRTAADTLVGQIREGEQLRLDCDNALVAGFSGFVRSMGVEYINAFMKDLDDWGSEDMSTITAAISAAEAYKA